MAVTIEKLENGGLKVTKGSKSATVDGPLYENPWDIKDTFNTIAKALEVGQNLSKNEIKEILAAISPTNGPAAVKKGELGAKYDKAAE